MARVINNSEEEIASRSPWAGATAEIGNEAVSEAGLTAGFCAETCAAAGATKPADKLSRQASRWREIRRRVGKNSKLADKIIKPL